MTVITSGFGHIRSTGYRTSDGFLVAVRQSSTLAGRQIIPWTNAFNNTLSDGPYYNGGALTTADYFEFEFSEACVFNGLRFIAGESAAHGVVQLQGSNDGTTYDDIGTPFTWTYSSTGIDGTSPGYEILDLGNETAYIIYRLQWVSGSWSSTHRLCEELWFAGPHSDRGGGNRSGVVTVSRNGLSERSSHLISEFVDGNYKNFGAIDQVSLNSPTSGSYLQFDFGIQVALKRVRINDDGQMSGSNYGTWKWQGSNDGSSFTDSGSSFTWVGGAADVMLPGGDPSDSYQYWRLAWVSGTSSNLNGMYEWIFELDEGGGGTETAQSYPVIVITT